MSTICLLRRFSGAIFGIGLNWVYKRFAPANLNALRFSDVLLHSPQGKDMKKILAIFVAFFASITMAYAAVNLNTATKEELITLDGIGEVKAQAIIDYRTKNGPFKSMADVDKVPGIGEGTLKKIDKEVSLSGKTTVAAKADAKPAVKAEAKPATAAPAPVAKAEMKKDAAPAKAEKPAAPAKTEKAMAADAKKADTKEMTPAEKKVAAAEEKKAKAAAAKQAKADKAAKAAEEKKAKADKVAEEKKAKADKVKADKEAKAAAAKAPKADKPAAKDVAKDAPKDAPKK